MKATTKRKIAGGSLRVTSAAVAAGVYPDIQTAAQKNALPAVATYYPIAENREIYNKLFAEYKKLHDYFGKENPVMDTLAQLQQ